MTIFIQRPHSGRRGHVSLEFQKSCTKVAFDWFNTFVGVNYTFDLCQVPTVFKNEIWWLFALINAVNICVRKDTSDSGIILQRQFTIHFHHIYNRNWHKKSERQRTCNPTWFWGKLFKIVSRLGTSWKYFSHGPCVKLRTTKKTQKTRCGDHIKKK